MGGIDGLKDIKLGDIDLGNVDGEKESANENFQNYFYDRHCDYSLLKNNDDKFIVKGKKGSGKTYLVKYLENQAKKEGKFAKTIKCSQINLNSLVEVGKTTSGNEPESFYTYIILIEIARLIFEMSAKDLFCKNPLKAILFTLARKKLLKFYKERYPDGNYSFDAIKSKSSEAERFDVESSSRGFIGKRVFENKKENEKEYKKKNAYEVVSELEKMIYKCLKYTSIILISDDLDEQKKDDLSSENFKQFLINYLNSTNSLNGKLRKYKSKLIVVIRDDLLDKLNAYSSNINKLITDSSIHIDWCEKTRHNQWDYDISKMILNKIRVSAKIDESISDKDIYMKFFSNKIDDLYHMDYLISRSLGRPRDIIAFLNIIKEQNPDSLAFQPSFYRDAMARYSQYFIGEFKNELKIYYEPATIEQIFDLISDFNKPQFMYNEINDFYQKNKGQYDKISDLKIVITSLYKIGLLGNITDGAVSFGYRFDGKNKPNFLSTFIVHYGAKKSLIVKKNKKGAKR